MTRCFAIKATFILFALILPASAQPQTITGKVFGVSDGDTITVAFNFDFIVVDEGHSIKCFEVLGFSSRLFRPDQLGD